MSSIVYEIKDNCRKKMLKYTFQAFSLIPQIKAPMILDAGCGTGVCALALAESNKGTIFAVDSDASCLAWLRRKANDLGCSDRINVIHSSVLDLALPDKKFDVVLAEGLLNIIGFENGLAILNKYLKDGGFLLIHDAFNYDGSKRLLLKNFGLTLINSFVLDETAWWDDYYHCLEKSINQLSDHSLFKNEINEIREYKRNSGKFKSIYYVLRK